MSSRIDQVLLKRGLASSRTQSQKMIAAGQVKLRVAGQWQVVRKASMPVDDAAELQVESGAEQRYVSRAGLKLEDAIARLGLQVEGLRALDVGQSTGGFTDCLIKHDVKHVVGVDVGRDQLAASLRRHERVSFLEGINARRLVAEQLGELLPPAGFDLVVMDVSFISQTLILPRLPPLMAAGAHLISLVKPQFEVGSEYLGKGGIVRDHSVLPLLEKRMVAEVEKLSLKAIDYFPSPITGGDGNKEFILVARKSP